MERVNAIYCHPLFCEQLEAIEDDEKDRRFCRHGLEHLMDVARIMYIYALEDEDSGLSRELLYAAAFLHDIGRHKQNLDGTPHEEAGAMYAGQILQDCGFTEEERALITDAIAGHRKGAEAGKLAEYLYRADKASRACFACAVKEECYWPDEKKNLEVGV